MMKQADSSLQGKKERLSICLLSREYPQETAWGGIGTYTHHLAHGLAARGHKVHVISESLEDSVSFNDHDITIHRIKSAAFFHEREGYKEFVNRFEYCRCVNNKLMQLERSQHFDIIEGPNFAAEAYLFALKRTGIPLVTRIHTTFQGVIDSWGWERTMDKALSCTLEDSVILNSDLILFSSEGNKQYVFDNLGIRPSNVRMIPLGIPLPDNTHAEGHYEKNMVLFVGRLEPRKGIDVLLRAIPAVIEKVPNARFCVVGRDTFVNDDDVGFSGDEEDSYRRKLLNSLPEHFHSAVDFVGYVPEAELERYYARCDIFVAPSYYESFGFIYIEAMAHGKPVIGCRVGGVPEVIVDGETGILIEAGNHEQCATAIVNLLLDQGQRDMMGQNARRLVAERFTITRMIDQTEEAYRSILKER
jgi:glycosyltransferase involved in cell wall biosynthesis